MTEHSLTGSTPNGFGGPVTRRPSFGSSVRGCAKLALSWATRCSRALGRWPADGRPALSGIHSPRILHWGRVFGVDLEPGELKGARGDGVMRLWGDWAGGERPWREVAAGWSCPAFTDGWFLGLMVSDVDSFLPPRAVAGAGVSRRGSERAAQASRASLARAPRLRFKPHG